jgi:hypothetical protein
LNFNENAPEFIISTFVKGSPLAESFGLTQNVDFPIWSHTLDLAFSREADNLVSQTCVKSLINDHYAVRCCLSVRTPRWSIGSAWVRSIKSIDCEVFASDLAALELVTSPAASIEDLILQYHDGLISVLDKHAPLKEKRVVLRPATPWMNHEIRAWRRKIRKSKRT